MSEPHPAAQRTAPASAPSFYRRPRPLDSVADRELSLRAVTDYRFARDPNLVLLGAAEYLPAAGCYPIVFTAREPYVAVAVLGFEESGNLFVAADGQWRIGHYIPAYVRRYPFIFFERPEDGAMVLGIDAASDFLVRSAEQPLFAGGEPTPLVREAIGFCTEFNRQTAASGAFVAALQAAGLLVTNSVRVTLNSGRQIGLREFAMIDEARFNSLSDEAFVDWRRRGWLPLAYAHLQSMNNWRRLGDLATAAS